MLSRAGLFLSVTVLGIATPGVAVSSTVHFPAQFVGSWANSSKDCEPELTGGFRIGPKTLSLYDGGGDLISLGPVTSVRTPSGLGRSVTAKIRFQDEEGPGKITSIERLTVLGKWIYRSEAKIPMTTHLSIKNRSIRCPPGSTG
jgi:hypothetical protein